MLEQKKTVKKVVAKKEKESGNILEKWLKLHLEAKHAVGEAREKARKELKELENKLRKQL